MAQVPGQDVHELLPPVEKVLALQALHAKLLKPKPAKHELQLPVASQPEQPIVEHEAHGLIPFENEPEAQALHWSALG